MSGVITKQGKDKRWRWAIRGYIGADDQGRAKYKTLANGNGAWDQKHEAEEAAADAAAVLKLSEIDGFWARLGVVLRGR